MGDIGKPIKRLELVPMPDDIPAPEVVPEQPAAEPERQREPVKVGTLHRRFRTLDGRQIEQDIDLIAMGDDQRV